MKFSFFFLSKAGRREWRRIRQCLRLFHSGSVSSSEINQEKRAIAGIRCSDASKSKRILNFRRIFYRFAFFFLVFEACESNQLCRRLTLKDYLPSVMTRFTKLKMLFEAMKKFVTDDRVESEKLSQCVERTDYILRRMNEARLKKEQEALLEKIKNNLEVQLPRDDKTLDFQHIEVKIETKTNIFCFVSKKTFFSSFQGMSRRFE